MSQDLIDKIMRAREVRIESGDLVFIISRPTELDIALAKKIDVSERQMFSKYVTGWEGMTESQIISSGDNTPVEFDHDLFCVWIEDHPEHWMPIAQGILKSYQAHKERREEALKN